MDEKKPIQLEHSGTAVGRSIEEQTKILDDLFGVLPSSSAADKKLLNQNFKTPESARSEPHSPLLKRKTASKHLVEEPTLTESVRAALRRA